MNIIIPPPPPNYNQYSFMQAFDAIRRAFMPLISKDEASPRILLQDVDGVVWQVTIDTSGNLHTAVNDGKSRL